MSDFGKHNNNIDDALHSATRALCNVCGQLTDGKIVFRGERVYLVKWCKEHGCTETLISSDKKWYQHSLSYVKPGTSPLRRAVSSFKGCPESCGLCARHEQHTCLPIVEITGECNLSCPDCLVAHTQQQQMSLDEFKGVLDGLISAEGKLNMVNISGGEPTLHPLFSVFLKEATERPEIGVVSVSTNGLVLDQDSRLIDVIGEMDGVVALQFDGFESRTYSILRGDGKLADVKKRVLEKLLKKGVKISLTVTLAKGINEHEIPRVLDVLFSQENVLSVMIQPQAHTAMDPGGSNGNGRQRVTIPDVIRLIGEGSGGVLVPEDFTPLPCSHPSCFALTYLLKLKNGGLVSLPKIIGAENYLDVIKNQALLGTDSQTMDILKTSLYDLWSASNQIPMQEEVLRTVKELLQQLNDAPSADHKQVLDMGLSHVKSIFIHQFMDRETFDLSRAVKCCNHYPQADGRLMPACIRNNIS